jgi:putative alpha-1,2-mannosidase
LDEAPGATPRANAIVEPLIDHVDPFVGTDDSSSPNPVPGGAGGSTYPGAVVPFGMVQLSPDTPTASPSGYRYRDTVIEDFSLTHFDGAGCANNEDLPFMPFVGAITASPGAGTAWSTYRAAYDKASEFASPGLYHVKLNTNIEVDLTATTRTGFVRLTYPASTAAQLLLNTGRSATGIFDGSVEIVGNDRIRGSAMAGNFCGSQQMFTIYFSAQLDRPFTAKGTWQNTTLSRGASTATGARTGAYVTFDTTSERTVQMKIGISFVSIENAEANLAAESPAWSFADVRAAAAVRWDQVLRRIEATGGSEQDLRKFYTALYHVFQSPNVASDVNGQYMGFDRTVHVADGWTVYQNYSGWDIIRSWTHLIAAVAPEAPDIIRSMVEDGVQGGLLPFWTHQSVETNVMVGDPGTVNVANAYAMGVRNFDTDAALALMLKSATNPNDTQRFALQDWTTLGYTSNAAISLEYAMADFAIAQFAGALGKPDVRAQYIARSDFWRRSWNPDQGFLEPRVAPSTSVGGEAARIYEVEVFGPDAPTVNLARAGTATASAVCNDNENASKAINGSVSGGNSDKWCDNTSAAKWWQLDLGAAHNLSSIVIHHAGDGGETPDWNTQSFTVSVSNNATDWTPVVNVTNNRDNITTHPIGPVTARYVRLDVIHSIQMPIDIGDWTCQNPFDASSDCGFIEGNAAQYVWLVPHNLEGLFRLMGGRAAAVARLDHLFTELNAGTNRPFFYIGNEPEHGTPWTYNFAAAPWKTQEVVRRIVDEGFANNAGGLPGNDDLGATSAWLVWAYLGMYPMIQGTDILVIHGPQFPSITMHLANGKDLTISGRGAGAQGAHFVQRLSVDGVATTRSWLRFQDLAHGATLRFSMGTTPNQAWGSGPKDVPPSFPSPATP